MKKLSILLLSILCGCVVFPHARYSASRVEGRILSSGHPVAHVKVIRKVVTVHSGKEEIQIAITDAEGRFAWARMMELGMVQSIATWAYEYEYYIEHQNERTLIWSGMKTGISDLGERFSSDINGRVSGKNFFKIHDEYLGFTYDLSSSKPIQPNQSSEPTSGLRPAAAHL